MKKHFKLALKGISFAAMLAFANVGFAEEPVAVSLAEESSMVAAPAKAKKTKIKKNKTRKKGSKAGKKMSAKDGAAADTDNDNGHDDKPQAAAKKKRAPKGMTRAAKHAHHEEAAEQEAWGKNEQALASLSKKIIAAAPKTVSEIAAITNDADRRVALYRFQEEASKRVGMKLEPVAEAEKEAYEAQLLKEAKEANVAYRQLEELVYEMKTDEHQQLLDKEELAAVENALVEGIEEDDEDGKDHKAKDLKKHKVVGEAHKKDEHTAEAEAAVTHETHEAVAGDKAEEHAEHTKKEKRHRKSKAEHADAEKVSATK